METRIKTAQEEIKATVSAIQEKMEVYQDSLDAI
jgi:hypothetical protein